MVDRCDCRAQRRGRRRFKDSSAGASYGSANVGDEEATDPTAGTSGPGKLGTARSPKCGRGVAPPGADVARDSSANPLLSDEDANEDGAGSDGFPYYPPTRRKGPPSAFDALRGASPCGGDAAASSGCCSKVVRRGSPAPDQEDEDNAASQALSYKVKLLHAGGWSSSSSGSEGQRTPPAPPPPPSHGGPGGSSSAFGPPQVAGSGGEAAGGLETDHMEQFTVSFVSDLQVHEDLEETSVLCTFCLDEMQIGEELCRLPCMHTFHRSCVHAWLARDRRCMLCRLDVTRPRG